MRGGAVMGELSIQGERPSVPRYEKAGRVEKRPEAGRIQNKAAKPEQSPVSESLRRLIARLDQDPDRSREGRRMLRTGQGALAEIGDSLSRMAALARKAAGGGAADRAALQSELEGLCDEIDRVLKSASYGDVPLFQETGGDGEGLTRELDALLRAFLTGPAAADQAAGDKTAVQTVPKWLMDGISQTFSREELLSALGLDGSATPAQLLAAVGKGGLGDSPAANYLAVLYLGAVIAGGGVPPKDADTAAAMDGIQRLLEKVAGGASIDEAIRELTNGSFTGLLDFETQFTGGTARGLADFLSSLLLSGGGLSALSMTDAALLSGLGGSGLDLLLAALTSAQSPNAPAFSAPEAPPSPLPFRQFGAFQVAGQDLSGVSFDPSSGVLTLNGPGDAIIRGAAQTGQAESTGQAGPVIVLNGSGTATLQTVSASALVVGSSSARILIAGENALGEVRLSPGVSLLLDGNGLLETGRIQGDRSNRVTLTGGALSVDGGRGDLGQIAVLMEPAALLAARAQAVSSPSGQPAEPFDLILKALVPGWNAVTGLSVDGRPLGTVLWRGDGEALPARLWLARGDPSAHGYPVHTVVIEGRDRLDEAKLRYAWLRWDEREGRFAEVSMYPDPFTVTGGVEGEDWTYEEGTRTLRILTDQVTGLSGGSGIDAEQQPFYGTVTLSSHLGEIALTLGGVDCRTALGRACDLGRDNDVTLFLARGTENVFLSGSGCAGVSLGDGTSLTIDKAAPPDNEDEPDPDGGQEDGAASDLESESETGPQAREFLPVGTLLAAGRNGGAGIGRDSGGSWDRVSRITIRGGSITAAGGGGGAGIGAGKHGFMGPISITGGKIAATGGGGGGAGIGGALGAPAGDITIRGGLISAAAAYHAAAIGAGVEGECGDILIGGTARILKAQGGTPEAGIGSCPFGKCGEIRISAGADIGAASVRPWKPEGVPLKTGGETVIFPRFVFTPRMFRLRDLDLSSRRSARTAEQRADAAGRHISLLQETYDALYRRLESDFDRLRDAQARSGSSQAPIRDADTAGQQLTGARRAILQKPSQAVRPRGGQEAGGVLRLLH